MWLWVAVIVIIVLLCGCRGGRSLGSGSAGTVIVPETPKQINERNRQPPQKLTRPSPPVVVTPPVVVPPVVTSPVVITPPVVKLPPTPPVKLTPAKTRPTAAANSSAKANPVIINPKPAGQPNSFTPTINKNAPPAKLEKKVNVIPAGNGDKGTNPPPITSPEPPEERPFIKWGELISYWLFVILTVVFGWVIYDTVMSFIKEKKQRKEENARSKKAQEKLIKKPAKGTRKSRKKAISKKGKK